MRRAVWGACAAAILAVVGSLGACNSGTADCPAKETIQPGGACSDDDLQCPYDLASPSLACDGTTTVLATSCTCTKGAWVCPDAVSCPGGDDAAPGDDAAGDDAAGDDGAGDDGATGDDGAAATDASDAG
jgi:hypothetical protein